MDCIQSVVKQMVSGVEILVVDNFGELKIQEKIHQFKYLDINIQYLFEKIKALVMPETEVTLRLKVIGFFIWMMMLLLLILYWIGLRN